jgi:hypothetical protein
MKHVTSEKGEDMSFAFQRSSEWTVTGGLYSRVLQSTGLEASLTESGRSHALCALMVHLVPTAAGNRSFPFVTLFCTLFPRLEIFSFSLVK